MRDALEFETQLANVSGKLFRVMHMVADAYLFDFVLMFLQFSLPREERRNVTKLYNPMTISELQEKFPSIPWLEYINRLLPEKVY